MFWEKEEDSSNKTFKKLVLAGGAAALIGFTINKLAGKRKPKEEDTLGQENYHEIDLGKRDRGYFLVYQNTNFEEEYEEGSLWAPEKTDSGRTIFHWENLKHIREDDLVFSLVDRKIVAVNRAKGKYYLDKRDGVDGYRVDLEYDLLDSSIDIEGYMEEILKRSPEKYAPFNVMGRSNSGYLFEIGRDMGELFLEIIEENKEV